MKQPQSTAWSLLASQSALQKSTTALAPLPTGDATIAISENALTSLIRKALAEPLTAHGAGRFGPFEGGYDLDLRLGGGEVKLIDANQQINIDDLAVWGSFGLRLGFDLNKILPTICIPPNRVCVNLGFGPVCTPQICVRWPSVSVSLSQLPILRMLFSPFFQLAAKQDGANWDVLMKVFPASLLSLRPDFDYLINTITREVERIVRQTLGGIPLIGDLIASLVAAVLRVFRNFISAILRAIYGLVRQAIILINLFSPTIPFKIASLPARQVILPAGEPGDGAVDLSIASVSTSVVDPEIRVSVAFA